MQSITESLQGKVVLITGAAHRVGACMARVLHREGMSVVVHYRHSKQAADALVAELNNRRSQSAISVGLDLQDSIQLPTLIEQAINAWGRLDLLVNNASSFYPTKVAEANLAQWDDLMSSNLKAPFFLSQAAAPHLQRSGGNIINIVDIHADRPLKGHSIYCMAKAGLVMMTKSLARELGPQVRVNAVAPGAILWPEGLEAGAQQDIVERTALKRRGDPEDIARAVLYLVRDAGYTTGQILAVDGGRTLSN